MLLACTYLLLLPFVAGPLLDGSILHGVALHKCISREAITVSVFGVLVLCLLVLVALPAAMDSARRSRVLKPWPRDKMATTSYHISMLRLYARHSHAEAHSFVTTGTLV